MNALNYPAGRQIDATEEAALRNLMRRSIRTTRFFAWCVFPLLAAMLLGIAWMYLSDGWSSGDGWVVALNLIAQPPIWWFALWVAPRAHRGGPAYTAPLRRIDGVLDRHFIGAGTGATVLRLGGVKVFVPKHWPEFYGLVRALAFVPHAQGRGLAFVVEMELLDEPPVDGHPPVLSVADDIQKNRITADAVLFRDRSTGPALRGSAQR